MSKASIDSLAKFLAEQPSRPPIEKWQPELSGDIDICIKADGRWFHEGDEIKRDSLLALFASILRREDDGEYYLVTPVEKWRLKVEECAFQLVNMELFAENTLQQVVVFSSNVGTKYELSEKHPLCIDYKDSGEPIPFVKVEHGLTAKLGRNIYYQLADLSAKQSDDHTISSHQQTFSLA